MTIDELYDVVEESYVNDEITYEDAMEIMEIAKGNEEKVSIKDKLYNKKLEDLKASYKAKEITRDEYNTAVDKLDKWYLGKAGYNEREEKKAKLKNIAKKVAIGAGVAAAAGAAGAAGKKYYKHAEDINKQMKQTAVDLDMPEMYKHAATRSPLGKIKDAIHNDTTSLKKISKRAGVTKESCDDVTIDEINNLKLECYESCDAGIITESERDLFLDELNSYLY